MFNCDTDKYLGHTYKSKIILHHIWQEILVISTYKDIISNIKRKERGLTELQYPHEELDTARQEGEQHGELRAQAVQVLPRQYGGDGRGPDGGVLHRPEHRVHEARHERGVQPVLRRQPRHARVRYRLRDHRQTYCDTCQHNHTSLDWPKLWRCMWSSVHILNVTPNFHQLQVSSLCRSYTRYYFKLQVPSNSIMKSTLWYHNIACVFYSTYNCRVLFWYNYTMW